MTHIRFSRPNKAILFQDIYQLKYVLYICMLYTMKGLPGQDACLMKVPGGVPSFVAASSLPVALGPADRTVTKAHTFPQTLP